MIPVPSSEVLEVWDWAEPLIEKAANRTDSGFLTEDVLTRIQARDMQLWVCEKAVCVTQIQVYPQHKTLMIVFVGGEDVEQWIDDMTAVLESWGSQMGCKYIEEYGRKGWEKIGKSRGYKPVYVVMRKAL